MLKRTLFLMVGVLVTFSPGRAQTASEGGYTVVSPQGGSIAAFLAVGTLFNRDIGNDRIDMGPAPILTDAALRVRIGGIENSGTALVIVNPSLNTATINLGLFNAFGAQIGSQTISAPNKQQISTFLNSVFQTGELLSSALMRVHSNIPVAILALDFSGVSVTAVPITEVAVSQPAGVVGGSPTIFTRVTGPTGGTTCPPPGITCPGVTPPPTGVIFSPPATIPATGTFTTSGTGVFVFPQIVPDGAAATITVANLSTTTLAVSFDSFNSSGNLLRSIPNIPVAPQGFVIFSSNPIIGIGE